ncbi:glutathione synthase [Ruminococcus sp. NK3A76]|uniref:glutathione synthase n=1 Tax=Ruminococcus sp. NK3A76 TaxID=877411 RepID=UPI000A0111C3|nr:glutathione synthase [Ruminococcus sp. NK3A76]
MKSELFYKGNYGIERETLRVDRYGALAQTPHPFGDDESITRDFCENQIELITPVCSSVSEAVSELGRLDRTVRKELAKTGEQIWLYSNPPHFEDESDIPVANFTGRHSGKRKYREQLQRRYGKRLMLFSGVHFNFSFDEEYLREISEGDFDSFRDSFYLNLYKQASKHSWLLLLLTAASPVCDKSLFKDHAKGAELSRYSSIRSSEKGYWNSFTPVLRFDSVDDYVSSVSEYVESGRLFSASEVYLPVRLKPRGVNCLENFKNGISHIELRMFDLDPTTKLGVNEKHLEFAHLLLMYLSAQPEFEYTPDMQREAVKNHRKAALYDLTGIRIDGVPIIRKAKALLDEIKAFFEGDENAAAIIEYEKNKLKNRTAKKIKKEIIYGQRVRQCVSCLAFQERGKQISQGILKNSFHTVKSTHTATG